MRAVITAFRCILCIMYFRGVVSMEHKNRVRLDDEAHWKSFDEDNLAFRQHEIHCHNMARQGSNSTTQFQCPEKNMPLHYTECCGPREQQYCCSPWETPGVKWGMAVGFTVIIFVLLAMGYSIQVFRACDRCYHDCPICGKLSNDDFALETRWYSVSHEGNRYGVTFHSKRFAIHFMDLLKARHGPWNTANMLKIWRDEQVFVILNIYFHNLFTPWFYTQGPIKNDELWIHSDFRDLIKQCVDDLSVSTACSCWCFQSTEPVSLEKSLTLNSGIEVIIVDENDHNIPSTSAATPLLLDSSSDFVSPTVQNKELTRQKFTPNGMKLDHRPWTKHTFRVKPTGPANRLFRNSFRRSRNSETNSGSSEITNKVYNQTVIYIDDIIEEYGNSKAIQTRREVCV